jgi:transposase-like protein
MSSPSSVELNGFDTLPFVLWAVFTSRRGTCPHCAASHTVRWGSFSGRQRYCCRECKRTFSSLTGTPAAYSKKLSLWAPYARCMAHGLTIRRTAAQLGIHPSTAFRWRHAFLDCMRSHDRERLAGWIELDSLRFAYSEKGRRDLRRAPYRYGVCPGGLFGEYAANVLVACDRRSDVITAITSVATTARIASDDIQDALAGKVRGRPIVTCRQGHFGAAALFARRTGGRFFDARRRARHATGRAHIRNARAYGQRMKDWIRRFRGVATRYLSNYLIWHRVVDRRWRQSLRRGRAVAEGDEALHGDGVA